LGQVRSPGFYDYNEDWKPKDYIDAAGGYGKQADKDQVRISRGSGDVLFADDVTTLAPGDLIWVPEHTRRSTWRLVRDVAAVTTTVVTIFLLFREVFGSGQ
jgi:protein involved in polysaccharide export with SLBB domain